MKLVRLDGLVFDPGKGDHGAYVDCYLLVRPRWVTAVASSRHEGCCLVLLVGGNGVIAKGTPGHVAEKLGL